jgi:hypothetical protein
LAKVTIVSKKDPSRIRSVPERDAKILVRLGSWSYQTTALEAGRPVSAAPTFASPAAAELAAGIPPERFRGRRGSGRDGSFTKPDVLELLGEQSS